MRALFQTFEEKSRLVRILNACIAGDGIRVLIGHENPDPELRDLSLVTAGCHVEGEPRLRPRRPRLDAHGVRPRRLARGPRGPGRVRRPAEELRVSDQGTTANDEDLPAAVDAGGRRGGLGGEPEPAAGERRPADGAASPSDRPRTSWRRCGGSATSCARPAAAPAGRLRELPQAGRARPAAAAARGGGRRPAGRPAAPSTTSSAPSRPSGAEAALRAGRRADPARAAALARVARA